MIKVRFLREIAGLPAGTIHEWSDKHSGLVRARVADGSIEVVKDEPEKVKIEKLPTKHPEKVDTKQAPKKPRK